MPMPEKVTVSLTEAELIIIHDFVSTQMQYASDKTSARYETLRHIFQMSTLALYRMWEHDSQFEDSGVVNP